MSEVRTVLTFMSNRMRNQLYILLVVIIYQSGWVHEYWNLSLKWLKKRWAVPVDDEWLWDAITDEDESGDDDGDLVTRAQLKKQSQSLIDSKNKRRMPKRKGKKK